MKALPYLCVPISLSSGFYVSSLRPKWKRDLTVILDLGADDAATSSDLPIGGEGDDGDCLDDMLPLWKLASAHVASQSLHVAIQLGALDYLAKEGTGTMAEISAFLGIKSEKVDYFQRLLRVLVTVDILKETRLSSKQDFVFSLTKAGKLLQRTPGMVAGISHWMEKPLWDAWLEVPNYLTDKDDGNDASSRLPFDRANKNVSSDFYYNAQDHPSSLQKANDFVGWIHQEEVTAVVDGLDWPSLIEESTDSAKYKAGQSVANLTFVDIGGHYGAVASAIATGHFLTNSDRMGPVQCFSLDLPEVIASAPIPAPPGVTFWPGNIMDVNTLPNGCNMILLKHFLDRCMWDEHETIEILRNCHDALCEEGLLVVAEAVLPDMGETKQSLDRNSIPLYMDALYMLVGREAQRTKTEWVEVAAKARFGIKQVVATGVPSCSLLVLEKAKD